MRQDFIGILCNRLVQNNECTSARVCDNRCLLALQDIDIPNIEIVVQYKAPNNLSTLWQQFSRAACGPNRTANMMLLVELKYTTVEQERLAMLALEKAEAKAAKAFQVANPGAIKQKKLKSKVHCDPPNENAPVPHPTVPSAIVSPNKYQCLSNAPPLMDITSQVVNTSVSNSASYSQILSKSSSNIHRVAVPTLSSLVRTPGASVSVDSVCEEIQQRYAAIAALSMAEERAAEDGERKKKKGDLVVVGSPVDDFINIHALLNCWHAILTLFFDNDKACKLNFLFSCCASAHSYISVSDIHLLCDPSAGSCTHCAPRAKSTCCDLCSPVFADPYFLFLQSLIFATGQS